MLGLGEVILSCSDSAFIDRIRDAPYPHIDMSGRVAQSGVDAHNFRVVQIASLDPNKSGGFTALLTPTRSSSEISILKRATA
jgi:hypothetical protein